MSVNADTAETLHLVKPTIARRAQSSATIAVGEVVGAETPLFNTPDRSRPAGFGNKPPSGRYLQTIYTPYRLSVRTIVKGGLPRGESVAWVEGGTVDCVTLTVDIAPRVEIGGRYVFILGKAYDTTGAAVPGVSLLGEAWPIAADGTVSTVEGPMSLDALRAAIARVPASGAP